MRPQDMTTTVRSLLEGDKGLPSLDESGPARGEHSAPLDIPRTEEAQKALLHRAARRGGCTTAMEGVPT